MIFIHVAAGSIGILFGFVAMFIAKGTARHRLVGNVYVVSMFTMSVSAFFIALARSQLINAIAATLTFYLVATAWMTMHRQPENPRRQEVSAAVLALIVGIAALGTGVHAASVPGGMVRGFEGIPAPLYFMFGTVALLASWGDYRLIRRRSITRTRRLVRHLWRMGFSFWVAASSLFLGQAKHLPTWFTAPKLNLIPVLLVLLFLVFWLVRVRFAPWTRKPENAAWH